MNRNAFYSAILLIVNSSICFGAAHAPAKPDSSILVYSWYNKRGTLEYGEYIPEDASEIKLLFKVQRKDRDDFPKEVSTLEKKKVKLWWKDITGIGGLTNTICRMTSREGEVELQSFTILDTGQKIQLILPRHEMMFSGEEDNYKAGIGRHPDELRAHYLYRIRGRTLPKYPVEQAGSRAHIVGTKEIHFR